MPQFTVDPYVNPGEWDLLIAAGQRHSGVFILGDDAAPRNYKWQVNDAPACQGTFMVYRGWRPSLDIKGTFRFWDQGQVESFYRDYLPIWSLDARKFGVNPIAVYHPALQANDITKLVTVQVGNLSGNSATGWHVKMTWHEYRPAKIISPRTPEGSTDKLGEPTPKSRTEIEIAKELALAKRPL